MATVYIYFTCGYDCTGEWGCDASVVYTDKENMKKYLRDNDIETGYIVISEEGEIKGEEYSPKEFLLL